MRPTEPISQVIDDDIDRMLRASADYVDDAGFTERVLATLPPRRRRLRPWILLGSAALGAFFAFVVTPGGELLMNLASEAESNMITLAEAANHRFDGPLPVLLLAVFALVVAAATAVLLRSET